MKNVALFAVIIAAMVFTGCSSAIDEIVPADDSITLKVNMPSGNASRASEVIIPGGYSMRCVMQLVDGNSNIVSKQKTAEVTAGKATFTITADERASAKRALLWADYIDTSGNSVYTTSDLCSVGYNVTTFDISKTDIRVLDAFCGIVDDLSHDASITLTRPLVNVLFTPANPAEFINAKSMKVRYTAPSAYNVSTQTSSGNAEFVLNNPSFDAAKTPWFSTFFFAPANMSTLGNDIQISLSEGLNYSFIIPGDKVSMNANYQVIFGAQLGSPNITLTVTINPDFAGSENQDPNGGTGEDPGKDPGNDPGKDPGQTTEFKVGAYVGADGSVVTSRDAAVGVIYHLGPIGADNAAAYRGVSATSIKGYAVALENVSATHKHFDGYGNSYSESNGIEYLSIIAENEDDFWGAYEAWTNTHQLSGTKTSGWYIPTSEQLYMFLHMICTGNDGSAATGDASFKELFPVSGLFDASQSEAVYSSCTWYNQTIQRTITVINKNSPKATNTEDDMAYNTYRNKQLCRPIFTIFE